MTNNYSRGIITAYVLIFGTIFLIILTGLLGFVLFQLRDSAKRLAWNEALQIAEAGANYYRWCLNNGVESQCLAQKEYQDLAGNPMGTFTLEITPSISCGTTTARTVISTGWTQNFPTLKRKVKLLHSKESVAKYAYLINDNVWAGSDREIRGFYHSNGGIRMDGENQSLVTSAKDEWICTASFGCSTCPVSFGCRIEAENCICPGIFTSTDNSNPDLFDFPIPPFDFDGITTDLAEIKSLTQPYPQEKYWPKVSDIDPEGKGYHLKFINNGTFEVWIITVLEPTYAYSLEEGWHYDYFTIVNEYRYGGPVSIDPNCSLVFIEDNLWLDGEVKGRVTVVSANLVNPNQDTDVVLPGNINYTALDGSDGLTIIGERNVLISPDSPNSLELRGIFVAQKGHFGRNLYLENIKEVLEIYGSIISNGRVGTKWSSGSLVVSGYLKRENYVDSNLLYNPPHYTPFVSSQLKIAGWEEIY